MSKKEREARKYAKKVKKLSQKPNLYNDKCADCLTTRPKWVSLTTGVFLCMKCSCVHRDLYDKKIKSIDFNSWNYDTYKQLKSKGGNKIINKNYESSQMRFIQSIKPNIKSDTYKRKQFVNLKYIEKKWYKLNTSKPKKKKKKRYVSDDEQSEESKEEEILDTKIPNENHTIVMETNIKNNAKFANSNLMDFNQMGQANQWNVFENNNEDDEKDNINVINDLLNGCDNYKNNINDRNSKNKILQRYKMQNNGINNMNNNNNGNEMNNLNVMKMRMNMNMMQMNMNNNISPIQMQNEINKMQMQLKQMEMKLNAKVGNNGSNNSYENDDDWADFDNIDNGNNNDQDDDNWANFDDM